MTHHQVRHLVRQQQAPTREDQSRLDRKPDAVAAFSTLHHDWWIHVPPPHAEVAPDAQQQKQKTLTFTTPLSSEYSFKIVNLSSIPSRVHVNLRHFTLLALIERESFEGPQLPVVQLATV